MGIPRFFRWVSGRYPLINMAIPNTMPTPVLDNLYLDMNGIIHNCARPIAANGFDAGTEDRIFTAILDYIQSIVKLIEPKKVLFMAIDGVAPRAKLNQQRQRRFKSAKEAKENLLKARKAAEKNHTAAPDSAFDSNCITPGTEFMAKLTKHLMYFAQYKASTDPLWQSIKVIVSGPEVPGEGEHKIMAYIRHAKQQPGYEPNQSHCLYGLDADLIMLALVTHEPNFVILREDVSRNRPGKPPPPGPPQFQLLFINLFREYLKHEFDGLSLSFPYEFERVVDDFIFLCFFVGNDFLPTLPNLDIAEGVIPKLLDIYCQALPTLPGYLTDQGHLFLDRLAPIFERLVPIEGVEFLVNPAPLLFPDDDEEEDEDEDEGNNGDEDAKKHSKKHEQQHHHDHEEDDLGGLDDDVRRRQNGDLFGDNQNDDDNDGGDASSKGQAASSSSSSSSPVPSGHASAPRRTEAEMDRMLYYTEKFTRYFDGEPSSANIESICEEYLRGLVWVLRYYKDGCCSWAWYFPFHYSPRVFDLEAFCRNRLSVSTTETSSSSSSSSDHGSSVDAVELTNRISTFAIGKPFLPFQQLMGVLPPASKALLPSPFQELMIDPRSPIIDYYPEEFESDLNGKRHDWEAVVLLGFIEEGRLLEAMATVDEGRLSAEERARNRHSHATVVDFDCNNAYPMVLTTLSGDQQQAKYPSVAPSYARCQPIDISLSLDTQSPDFSRAAHPFRLLPEAQLGAEASAGFPSLEFLPYRSRAEDLHLRTFSGPYLHPTRVVSVDNPLDALTELPASLPSHVWINYPFLSLARPTRLIQPPYMIDLESNTRYVMKPAEIERYESFEQRDRHRQMNLGLELHGNAANGSLEGEGEEELQQAFSSEQVRLLEVQPFTKPFVRPDGSQEPGFAQRTSLVLLSRVRLEPPAHPHPVTFAHGPLPTTELFPLKAKVVVAPDYNQASLRCAVGTVTGHDGDFVNIACTPVPLHAEPLPGAIEACIRAEPSYTPIHEVARHFGLAQHVVEKVLGSLNFNVPDEHSMTGYSKSDLGLGLTFSNRTSLQVPGYSRKLTAENGHWDWYISSRGMIALETYLRRFPELFAFLDRQASRDNLDFEAAFNEARVEEVEEFLNSMPYVSKKEGGGVITEPTGTVSLSPSSIEALAALELPRVPTSSLVKPKKGVYKKFLIRSLTSNEGSDAQTFPVDQPGTRVLCVLATGSVPFGSRGVVVGFEPTNARQGLVTVLFDRPVPGAELVGDQPRLVKLHSSLLLPIPQNLPDEPIPQRCPVFYGRSPARPSQGRHSQSGGGGALRDSRSSIASSSSSSSHRDEDRKPKDGKKPKQRAEGKAPAQTQAQAQPPALVPAAAVEGVNDVNAEAKKPKRGSRNQARKQPVESEAQQLFAVVQQVSDEPPPAVAASSVPPRQQHSAPVAASSSASAQPAPTRRAFLQAMPFFPPVSESQVPSANPWLVPAVPMQKHSE